MNEGHNLCDVQHWLLTGITGSRPPSSSDCDKWLTRGPHLSASQRLAVYRDAYLARLLGVLRELFPCARFAAGDEVFDALMLDYLQNCPPRSYTLARLADRLVVHLEATRPADWGAFLVELARLEEAIDRVFDGPGGEELPPLALPERLSNSMQLTLTPGLELLAFRFPVSTFYSDWKSGRQPEWPEPKTQYVALLRRDYVVRRYPLDPSQFELLTKLQAGETLENALAGLIVAELGLDDIAMRVRQWFAFWTAERFFAAAHVPPAGQ